MRRTTGEAIQKSLRREVDDAFTAKHVGLEERDSSTMERIELSDQLVPEDLIVRPSIRDSDALVARDRCDGPGRIGWMRAVVWL
jgi:hypothetical protein